MLEGVGGTALVLNARDAPRDDEGGAVLTLPTVHGVRVRRRASGKGLALSAICSPGKRIRVWVSARTQYAPYTMAAPRGNISLQHRSLGLGVVVLGSCVSIGTFPHS